MKFLKKTFSSTQDFTNRYSRVISVILLILSLIALVGSSVYVGYKSGVIHLNNHDNLVDNYLFESPETFENALFPAAHTFLLKWPVFAVSALLGNTENVYLAGTVFLYLITVLSFLYIVYRLSHKNLFITAIGAIALTNILLMIPPQPNDGALLPLNMAMITTRNIEFIIFFIFIYLALRSKKATNISFILSVTTLSLLGATDKFFVMIALAMSVLYLIYIYSPLGGKMTKTTGWLVLIASVVSYIVSSVILVVLNATGVTNIPDPTNAAPFAIVSSVWMLFEAIAGGIQATVANFGADVFGKGLAAGIAPLILNGLLLLSAIWASFVLFFKQKDAPAITKDSRSYKFTLLLFLSYVAAFILFIGSEHDYLVDGRYLTGALFAGIAALTVFLRVWKISHKSFVLSIIAIVLLSASPFHLLVSRNNYTRATGAMEVSFGNRTSQAAQILKDNNVTVLVGDYWFVTPVKLKMNNEMTPVLMATGSCDQANTFLTSNIWYIPDDTVEKSALYILRDAGDNATTFNHGCTIEYLNEKYGQAESEFVIRSNDEGQPVDIIRIYNNDIRTQIEPPLKSS